METEIATMHPAGQPIDLRHLDATLTNLRAAERGITDAVTVIAAARDRLAAAPHDAEARQAVRFAEMQMRAAATMVTQNLEAMSLPGWAAP